MSAHKNCERGRGSRQSSEGGGAVVKVVIGGGAAVQVVKEVGQLCK